MTPNDPSLNLLTTDHAEWDLICLVCKGGRVVVKYVKCIM